MRVRLPNGEFLEHASTTYDPVEAHKYYEEHKHLKGRQLGRKEAESAVRRSSRSNSYTVKTASGSYRVSAKQLQAQREFANERVQQLKGRLARLGAKLRERMAEARKAEADAKKPKTAAEKSEDARNSKEYRDKHKASLKSKAKKAEAEKAPEKKTDTVASLKVEIAGAKSALKNAVAKQRALATATKNG